MDALQNTVSNILNSIPRDEDTYIGADGLEYCERCNTARQCRIELFGEVKTVPCICKCMAEARELEEKQKREAKERRRLREVAFYEVGMLQKTFETDDKTRADISKALMNYVEHFDEFRATGKGLLLYGQPGTGKTFFAACVVNALINKCKPCLMTNFSRLTNTISGMWEGKQQYIDSLTKFSLVAIDDLGVERDTTYMNENVMAIIDSLYTAKVPIIITSNYTPAQLVEETDLRRKRVYDRLLERCHPIAITGESRRKTIGREDYKKTKDILGV